MSGAKRGCNDRRENDFICSYYAVNLCLVATVINVEGSVTRIYINLTGTTRLSLSLFLPLLLSSPSISPLQLVTRHAKDIVFPLGAS